MMRRTNLKRSRRRTQAERKTTFDSSDVISLHLDKIEELICKTIQPYCRDAETSRQYRYQFLSLAMQSSSSLSRTEIDGIISILIDVLNNSSSDMPCTLVAYIHSTIGLLKLTDGETRLAIQSLTKALWIQTSLQSLNHTSVGDTLYRLAVCHVKLGEQEEAQTLLEKTLRLYKQCTLKNDGRVVRAQEELNCLQAATDQTRNIRRKSNEGKSLKLAAALVSKTRNNHCYAHHFVYH